MLSPSAVASDSTKEESKLGVSSPTPDTRFDSLFPTYSHNMFSGLLDGDLLDEEMMGKFALTRVEVLDRDYQQWLVLLEMSLESF
jgi:hypothetical protein